MYSLGIKTYFATEALEAYRRVKLSATSGYVEYADGDNPGIGFTLAPAALGEQVSVQLRSFNGTVQLEAAGAIALGGDVYGAADGKIEDVVGSNLIGIALQAATAAADVIEVLPVGASVKKTALAVYDFAVHGGSIGAIGLGVTLPNKAVITGGFVDVITTCTTASADAGTMALHANSAGDLVAAIAVSDASNPWDAGRHDIIPDNTGSTAVKLTAARELTATIATQAFTAGKFVLSVDYVVSI